MFNTTIQPGIWGDFVQKTSQKKGFSSNVATEKIYDSPAQNQTAKIQTQKSVKNFQTIDNKEISQKNKKKIGVLPKLIMLAFATIAVIWGIPALNNALIKKEKNLPRLKKRYERKIRILNNKGEDAVLRDKKDYEKKIRRIDFQKNIFEKINKTTGLRNIKEKFSNVANYIESKVQKPFKTFMQKHIFGFIKN